MVSNLSLGSPGSRPRISKAHLPTSAPFRARRQPGIRPVPRSHRLEERGMMAAGPVAFRPPASASWASCPAEGFCPSCDRPTHPDRIGPRRGFHVPRMQDATGVGAPSTPRPAVFTRPACRFRSPLAASASGQALPPGCSSRRSGLSITRRHRGFTCVRPSGLPLARLLPRTERGPLGFSLELRTPSRQDPSAHVKAGTGHRTLTRNYASGIAGLQSASSLAMRDFVSHPQVSIIAPPAAYAGSDHPLARRGQQTPRVRPGTQRGAGTCRSLSRRCDSAVVGVIGYCGRSRTARSSRRRLGCRCRRR